MKIAGHQLTNIVVAERYQGWLGIIGVSAMVIQPSQNGGTSSRDAGADGTAIKTKKETARWSALPAVFRLGRVDAGEKSASELEMMAVSIHSWMPKRKSHSFRQQT
jgi:hypothetical protein